MTHKAVILGNGPDRPTNIKWMNNLEGDIYGCNAIYRDFEPDFLVATDWEMMLEIINSTYSGNCHFTFYPLKKYDTCPSINLQSILENRIILVHLSVVEELACILTSQPASGKKIGMLSGWMKVFDI